MDERISSIRTPAGSGAGRPKKQSTGIPARLERATRFGRLSALIALHRTERPGILAVIPYGIAVYRDSAYICPRLAQQVNLKRWH
jgi:hypothetical protein